MFGALIHRAQQRIDIHERVDIPAGQQIRASDQPGHGARSTEPSCKLWPWVNSRRN